MRIIGVAHNLSAYDQLFHIYGIVNRKIVNVVSLNVMFLPDCMFFNILFVPLQKKEDENSCISW